MLTEEGCRYVSSALSSNPSHLRELVLSYNHPGDSGVNLLSNILNHPHCTLDKLKYVKQYIFFYFIIQITKCHCLIEKHVQYKQIYTFVNVIGNWKNAWML